MTVDFRILESGVIGAPELIDKLTQRGGDGNQQFSLVSLTSKDKEGRLLFNKGKVLSLLAKICALAINNRNSQDIPEHANKRRSLDGILWHIIKLYRDKNYGSIDSVKVTRHGLIYDKSGEIRSTIILNSSQQENLFLQQQADELAFVVDRLVVDAKADNLIISMPGFALGINRLALAFSNKTNFKNSFLRSEFEEVMADYGWNVALMGMLLSDVPIETILSFFNNYKADYNAHIPGFADFSNLNFSEILRSKINATLGMLFNQIRKDAGGSIVYLDTSFQSHAKWKKALVRCAEYFPNYRIDRNQDKSQTNEGLIKINTGTICFVVLSFVEKQLRYGIKSGRDKSAIMGYLDKLTLAQTNGFTHSFLTLYPIIRSQDNHRGDGLETPDSRSGLDDLILQLVEQEEPYSAEKYPGFDFLSLQRVLVGEGLDDERVSTRVESPPIDWNYIGR